jgi:hypothetical protein
MSDFDIKFGVKLRTAIKVIEKSAVLAKITLQRNTSACLQIVQWKHSKCLD